MSHLQASPQPILIEATDPLLNYFASDANLLLSVLAVKLLLPPKGPRKVLYVMIIKKLCTLFM